MVEAMNDIQELLAQLREKKWTYAAISDELGVHLVTVQTWQSGKFYPSNAKPVALALRDLLGRKRIPKKKRYSAEAVDTWQREGRYSESRAKGNGEDGETEGS